MTLAQIAMLTIAAGLGLVWFAARRLRRARPFAATAAGIGAVAVLATGALLLGLATTFHALDRLTRESPIGTLSFRVAGSRAFDVVADLDGLAAPREFRLHGDQWQLDVRYLKWRSPVTLLGVDNLYQLDRLSGRYRSTDAPSEATPTAYGLADRPGRLLWELAARSQRWLPWVDASYGSAVYLPMADGARYTVSVTTAGLLARPANDAARQALESW
jgi:hypothetical protein